MMNKVVYKTVWSMPERFKVVCIPCKAPYKCSTLPLLILPWECCLCLRCLAGDHRCNDYQTQFSIVNLLLKSALLRSLLYCTIELFTDLLG